MIKRALLVTPKHVAQVISNPLITGQTLGTIRNDFTGRVGFKFTVGSRPIPFTKLGRWIVALNSGTHTIRLANSSGSDLGTVTLATTGQTAGAYAYAALGTPPSS